MSHSKVILVTAGANPQSDAWFVDVNNSLINPNDKFQFTYVARVLLSDGQKQFHEFPAPEIDVQSGGLAQLILSPLASSVELQQPALQSALPVPLDLAAQAVRDATSALKAIIQFKTPSNIGAGELYQFASTNSLSIDVSPDSTFNNGVQNQPVTADANGDIAEYQILPANITAGVKYFVRARFSLKSSTSGSAPAVDSEYVFTSFVAPGDETPNVVSNLTLSAPTNTSVKAEWTKASATTYTGFSANHQNISPSEYVVKLYKNNGDLVASKTVPHNTDETVTKQDVEFAIDKSMLPNKFNVTVDATFKNDLGQEISSGPISSPELSMVSPPVIKSIVLDETPTQYKITVFADMKQSASGNNSVNAILKYVDNGLAGANSTPIANLSLVAGSADEYTVTVNKDPNFVVNSQNKIIVVAYNSAGVAFSTYPM
jgi:hypothetical protein